MINKKLYFVLLLFLLVPACDKVSTSSDTVIIGIGSDIDSFNPTYGYSFDEVNIFELMYLDLVDFKWDAEKGTLYPRPMLAKDWEWSGDSSSIIFNLRDDVYWSDGVKCTAEDIVFSYDVLSDPLVNSRFYNSFQDFYTDENNHIDIEKTFEIINPYRIRMNFPPGATPELNEISLHFIPKHLFEKVDRKNFSKAEEHFKPVTNGAFTLEKWERNQAIILKVNEKSHLYNPGNISRIIFKIVPDYNSRITQLKNGELDFVESIKTDDIEDLEKLDNLKIASQSGRDYDYIGWNNIDPDVYKKTGMYVPHKLFGDPDVRRALTYAINRQEILDEFLKGYGMLSSGPVSPIFKEAADHGTKPYEYDPSRAREILASKGWKDTNNDGIIEKDGKDFSFTLNIPAGHPRRIYASTIVKNNLKAVGVNVNIEAAEFNVLIDHLNSRSMDSWMLGWGIRLPLDLKESWHSDLEKHEFNMMGYRNKEADILLEKIEKESSPDKKNNYFRELHKIIHKDEPATFLYWIDNIAAYNSSIQNVNIDPLGVISNCWEWSIKE